MTDPSDLTAPRHPWTAQRVLIGLGGILSLVVGGIVTVGLAGVGLLGIGIGWAILRHRGRRLTPFVAWAFSAGAAALPMLVILGRGALTAPALSAARTATEMSE